MMDAFENLNQQDLVKLLALRGNPAAESDWDDDEDNYDDDEDWDDENVVDYYENDDDDEDEVFFDASDNWAEEDDYDDEGFGVEFDCPEIPERSANEGPVRHQLCQGQGRQQTDQRHRVQVQISS